MANAAAPYLRLESAPGRGAISRPPVKPPRANQLRALAVTLFWYVVVVLLMVLAPYSFFHPFPATVGEPARADIAAPFGFRVIDRQASEAALEKVIENYPRIWVRDEKVESRALQRLQGFLAMLRKDNPKNNRELSNVVEKVRNQLDIAIDDVTANQFQESRLLSLRPPLNLDEVGMNLTAIIQNVLNDRQIASNKVDYQAQYGQGVLKVFMRDVPIAPPDPSKVLWWPQEARDYLLNTALPNHFPGDDRVELRQACAELLMHLLAPNLVYDSTRSQALYEEIYRQRLNTPIYKAYESGELIVHKGERLTPLQADALARMNEMRRNSMAIKLIGIMLIVGIFFAAVGFYLKRFRRDVTLSASTITLHVLPPLMALAIGQAMMTMGLGKSVVMIWFPAAMTGMLSALLMTPQVAFILVLVSCCLFGIVTDQDMNFLIFTLFGGFSAIFASRMVRARGEMLLVGVQVGLINIFTLIILSLLKEMKLPTALDSLGAFLSGIACALSTLILLVIFERTFGIVTDMRLLELTGLKQALISQFEEKSPGSYQHVLNVMKLAEAAAQAIGANYLLVRAGAYYHDIGKMVKPKYFSENQVTLDDKRAHSKLSPYMSVLIIKNHVKEGVELAKRYNLPQKVVDFIPQHHGTGLIRYFYTEAMKRYAESGAIDEPREEDFRYPGPKPQSIETAIVLLADSVEAISASKFTGGQVSEYELRRMVQTAISEKFDDGQFDECDLTLRHLYRIREAFVRTLMARYHFRVAYPALPKREPLTNRESRETLPAPIAIAGPASPS